MNKKTGRKIISFILTLAMVFSMLTGIMPGTGLISKAEIYSGQIDAELKNYDILKSGAQYDFSEEYEIKFLGGGYCDISGNPYDEESFYSSSVVVGDNGLIQYENTDLYPYVNGHKVDSWTVVSVNHNYGLIKLTGFEPVWESGDCIVTYEDGTLTVTKKDGDGDGAMEDNTYPWQDYYGRDITSVVVCDGVTHIGEWAFLNLSHLENVTLPQSSLTSIGDFAFVGSMRVNYTDIQIPSSVTNIGTCVFNSALLENVTFVPAGENATLSISEDAFEECSNATLAYADGDTILYDGDTPIEAGTSMRDLEGKTLTWKVLPQTSVPYVYYTDDVTTATKHTDGSCTDFTTVSESTTEWSNNGWYVVSSDVTIDDRITVNGTANLILCDGATLTASMGITVNEGNILKIYAQSAGTGKLVANGGVELVEEEGYGYSGIGGANENAGGTIIIHGGTVTATAIFHQNGCGAGIGGGVNGNGGSVVIYDGTVTATSEGGGAGIGGGIRGNGGSVAIYGGTVTATGDYSVGIGKGLQGSDNGSLTLVTGVEMQVSSDNSDWTAYDPTGYGRAEYMRSTYTPPVSYVYFTDDGTTATKYTDGSCTDYTTVGESTTEWGNDGWYVVSSDVTIDDRISVAGTANLILCDGATLTAEKGISVQEENELNIYAQDSGTGTLTATGGEYAAGIGGNQSGDGGTLTIHGGNITATGGEYAAGIGGGTGGNGGTVTIYSGTVNATGEDNGAGIGSGGNSESSDATAGTVTIFGGTVTATGSSGGAGIGSGDDNYISDTSGTVIINGGTVNATGDGGGAGIGGGYGSAGCNVTINGGNVTANGDEDAMGIGRGGFCEYSNGNLNLGASVEMKLSNDNSTWEEYDANNGTRTRYMTTGDLLSVTITPDSNMTKTTNSGAASQTCIGAMTAVVYTANDGYYFPEDYSATAVNSTSAVNGISVTRDSISQITVSGTPTDDTEITLTAPSLIVPTGVSLDKHEINVTDHDGYQTLTATISPDGATGTLVWSSSNSSVASVASNDDNTATVTINGVGTANITVTIQGTSITDVCTVNVAEYVCPHDNKTETPAKGATCTESGNNKYYYCEDCNKYLKADGTTVTTVQAETIPALGHNYEGVAYSSDETQHWKTCCRCNEDSAKENHFFGDTTYTWSNDNATCTAFHTCEVCGKEVREIVNSTTQVTQATCTNSEITKYTARFTKDGFEVQTKDVETGNALGHVWGAHCYEWSDDYSTVTAKRRCTRADCNETQTETVGTSVETTATCTEPGTTTYTATFTNEVFNDDSMFDDGNGRTKNVAVNPLGHDWNTTAAVPATCTTAGNNEYKKCKRCGEYNVEVNSWVIPALGHSFVYDANGATVTATCEHDRCKYKNAPAKLTIVAPTLTTVGGKGSESATLTGLTDFNTATGLSVSADSIRYFKATKNGTTYTKSGSALNSAPTDAGDYLAEITVSGVKTGAETTGNVTAGLGYTIAKEAPIHSEGTISTSGIYCMSNHPSIQAGINIQKSNEADTVEYRWVGCNTNDPMKWFEVSPWTKNNNWMDWTPEKSGDYVFVCYARVVGNEEASQIEYAFGTEYRKGIKSICQIPYTGAGGGYLIGLESYHNPNNSYQYEILILDCNLYVQNKDPWVYTTGKCGSLSNCLWTVWQPQYGYYWTLFRLYDADGNLLDEVCYGFQNIF